MSEKDEGVQQHFTNSGATNSTYFHCFAHRLNLVLEKSVATISTVNDFFDIIGSVYCFMEGSPKRHPVCERKLAEFGIAKGKTALHSFSDN